MSAAIESPLCEVEEWDDTKFRHAYLQAHLSRNKTVSICGYDGPSTYRQESDIPENVCPICIALLPEHWDFDRKQWR